MVKIIHKNKHCVNLKKFCMNFVRAQITIKQVLSTNLIGLSKKETYLIEIR